MLALVRLLPPEVYGQFGFVTALLGFLTLYSFREFLGHTLVVRDAGDVHYQDHFTAGAVLQVAVFALANMVALGLRWFPEYVAVAPVLHVMSVSFLLDLPSELRVKMLERALDWRRLRGLHAVSLVASGLLSLVMALAGFGVYALLVPTMIVPVVFAWDLFAQELWRPAWTWSWARYRPSWDFGSVRIGSVSFVSGAGLLEATWLSALSFTAFGLFGRAVGLGQLLCGRVAGLIAQSVFPVLARIPRDSDAYRRASGLYLRGVAWLVVPLGVGLGLLASPAVRLLYGAQWLEVIPLLPLAMTGAVLMALVHTAYVLMLAHELQRRCLMTDIWRLVGTTGALATLAGFGLAEYLMGLVAVHAVSLALVLYWLAEARALTGRAMVEALAPPILAIIPAAAGSEFVRRLSGAGDLGAVAAALEGGMLSLVYLATLRLAFPRQLHQLVDLMPERQRVSRWLRLERVV